MRDRGSLGVVIEFHRNLGRPPKGRTNLNVFSIAVPNIAALAGTVYFCFLVICIGLYVGFRGNDWNVFTDPTWLRTVGFIILLSAVAVPPVLYRQKALGVHASIRDIGFCGVALTTAILVGAGIESFRTTHREMRYTRFDVLRVKIGAGVIGGALGCVADNHFPALRVVIHGGDLRTVVSAWGVLVGWAVVSFIPTPYSPPVFIPDLAARSVMRVRMYRVFGNSLLIGGVIATFYYATISDAMLAITGLGAGLMGTPLIAVALLAGLQSSSLESEKH